MKKQLAILLMIIEFLQIGRRQAKTNELVRIKIVCLIDGT
jgi:hypothetical protein